MHGLVFARLLCLYQNLFVPCKKLVSKTPKDKLHTKYKYAYDKPMTPLDRCIASGSCNPAAIAKIKALRDKTNVVALVSQLFIIKDTEIEMARTLLFKRQDTDKVLWKDEGNDVIQGQTN